MVNYAWVCAQQCLGCQEINGKAEKRGESEPIHRWSYQSKAMCRLCLDPDLNKVPYIKKAQLGKLKHFPDIL